jgi:preprotein translocase subunit SecG
MEVIVLIIHLLVCICLIGLVLLQRSEGGALGMGGGGAGALMSGRGAADALAKMTSVAGGFFLVTSLGLTLLSGAAASSDGSSVFDRLRDAAPAATAPAPQTTPPPAEPESTRPDPTQSSLPAETQLASTTVPAPETAPPATIATTRAGPLNSAPATQRSAPPAAQQRVATNVPASTQTSRPPAPAPERSAPATIPAPTERLVLPDTSGAVSGVNLTDDDPSATESIDISNGVEAVRRERAGPER